MATFKCRVVSAKEEIYAGDIQMLVATGSEGELGILAGHVPLITLLKPGPMHLKTADGADEVIYIKGGYLEVQPKVVTVLASAAQMAHSLNEAQIAEARHKAEQLLANQSSTLQTQEALLALAESVAQLQTMRRYKNRVQVK